MDVLLDALSGCFAGGFSPSASPYTKPDYVKSAGSLQSWLNSIDRRILEGARAEGVDIATYLRKNPELVPTKRELDEIIGLADNYGVRVGHDGARQIDPQEGVWVVRHINFTGSGSRQANAHIPVPPGYRIPQ